MRTLDEVVAAIEAVPLKNGRRMIAIAGAPGSGKSTIAETLQGMIPASCVLPMDGFHRSNEDLKAHGLFAHKGAPETFDVTGFAAILQAVAAGQARDFPTFAREQDAVVPSGGTVTAAHSTILVEGNYLLLDVAPWRALHTVWDFSILLNVPLAELEKRLVARWLDNGLSAANATRRAHENDLPNAQMVAENSVRADMVCSF